MLELLKKIRAYCSQKEGMYRLAMLFFMFTVILAVIPISATYIFSLILNKLIADAASKTVASVGLLAGVYTAIQVLPFFIRNVSARVNSRIQMRLRTYLQVDLEKKMAHLDHAYFDDADFHDLIKSVKEKGVSTTLGLFLLQFDAVEIVIQMVLAGTAISVIGIKYALVLAVATLPIILVEAWKRSKRKKLYDDNRVDYRYAGAYLNELGTRESRVFNLNDAFLGRYTAITNGVIHRIITFEDRRVIIDVVAFVLFGWGLLYVLKATFLQIALGNLIAGTAVLIISSVWTFSGTLRTLVTLIADVYENQLYSKEYFDFLELPQSIVSSHQGVAASYDQGMHIDFSQVSFRYPKKATDALTSVSLKINSGEKVAFVGENGGGKSTMIKLILRFYDPTSGIIEINGVPLNQLQLDTYRNAIGYVAQNPGVPNLVIREALTHHDALLPDQLTSALERSRSDEFIRNYKNGVDQQLGKMFKGGVNPSDGQRQRLAIARAYTKNPKLLILDEPTSDLDPDTQAHIFDDFYLNNPGVTGIVVAHSLQGVMRADRIYVFEGGVIVQVGTHDELVKVDGWYKRSFEKQFKGIYNVFSSQNS